jgi:hypothetical protein
VLFGKNKKLRERFYLLPGQGGRNYRQKQRRLLAWSVIASLFFGVGLTAVMWWLSHPKH